MVPVVIIEPEAEAEIQEPSRREAVDLLLAELLKRTSEPEVNTQQVTVCCALTDGN